MNTRPGAPASRPALIATLGIFLLATLGACGSTSSAPVRERDLVVANPVSVSPGIATRPRDRAAQPSTPPSDQASAQPHNPRHRPGALVRAPRPGADLSVPPEPAADTNPPPARASDNQIQSTIKVAAANQPKATPPARQPDPKPRAADTPPKSPASSSADWWKTAPAPAPGRLRIVASGVGSNLREAREAAVESGLTKLRAAIGADPEEVTYERTTVQPEGSGVLRGYVLVSCKAPA